MDPEIITWIWLAVGLLLIASEFFVPGMVAIFAGLAAVAVSLLRAIGIIEGLPASFLTWMVTSIVLVLSLRKTAHRWFPPETSTGTVDEETLAYGTIVDVVEACSADHREGRIRYQGTNWTAVCTDGTIPAGARAKLVYRDNLDWVVEEAGTLALSAKEESASDAVPTASTTKEADSETLSGEKE